MPSSDSGSGFATAPRVRRRAPVDRRTGGQKRLPMPGRGDERVPASLFTNLPVNHEPAGEGHGSPPAGDRSPEPQGPGSEPHGSGSEPPDPDGSHPRRGVPRRQAHSTRLSDDGGRRGTACTSSSSRVGPIQSRAGWSTAPIGSTTPIPHARARWHRDHSVTTPRSRWRSLWRPWRSKRATSTRSSRSSWVTGAVRKPRSERRPAGGRGSAHRWSSRSQRKSPV